jgi:hypothetical protein
VVLVSSTTGNEMFLSPHVLDIESVVASYVIAHELGHVFHNRFMGSNRWRDYRALRGISDETRFNDIAAHADRPREIFAEDFRVLFGGSDAYFGGHIEKHRHQRARRYRGVAGFLHALDARRSAPEHRRDELTHPFNPETEIRVTMRPARAVRKIRCRFVCTR